MIGTLVNISKEIDFVFDSVAPEKDGTAANNDLFNKKIKDFVCKIFQDEEINDDKLLKVIKDLHKKEIKNKNYKQTCDHIYHELFFRTVRKSDLFLHIIKNGPPKDFKEEHKIFINQVKQYVNEQRRHPWTDLDNSIITSLLDGVTNEKVRIEIAKIAAAENGRQLSECIKHYGITDEKARIEIAKIAAAHDSWGISMYIQHYGVTNEKARIAIAKIAAATDGVGISRYIQHYGITNEQTLIEIAKIAVGKRDWGTSQYIQNYGITNEKARIAIAKIAAMQSSSNTSQYIGNYGIKSEDARILLAKIAAAQNGWAISQYIQNYGITNEKVRIAIAKIAAAEDGWRTSQYIQHYGITKQNELTAIAKIAAAQNGEGTSLCIGNYGIKSQDARIEIAKIASVQDGWGTSKYFQNYCVTNEKARIAIAKIAAAADGAGISRYIQYYGITKQNELIAIAKIAAAQDGAGTSLCIGNYGIKSQDARIEIAKIASAQDGEGTSTHIQNYDITKQNELIAIAKIAAVQMIFNEISIESIKNLFIQTDLTKLLIEEASIDDYRKYFDINRSNKPCSEWGYRLINALPNGLNEVNLQQRIHCIIGIVLSMEGHRVSFQEIKKISDQNDLHQALLELQDPKMRRTLFQHLADLLKKGVMETFYTWLDSLNSSGNLSENRRKVRSIQILAALILAGHCEQETALAILNKIDRNFIYCRNRNLLLYTLELIIKSPINRDQADQIFKGLFSFKDSKSIVQALKAMKGIFSFGKVSDLTAVGHLNFNDKASALKKVENLFSKAFIEAIHLENKEIENFSEEYEKTFRKFRDPEAIKKYAASLAQLPLEERQPTLSLLGEYAIHVLEGSFKEWRYENSSHLNALWANNEKLHSAWKNLHTQEPLEKFLKKGSEEGSQNLPNFKKLIRLSLDQNHIPKAGYPDLYNYLFFKDQRKQIMDEWIHVMQSKIVEGTPEEKKQLEIQKNRVKFQQLVVRLARIQKKPVSVDHVLNILKEIGAYRDMPKEFKNDIVGWVNGLENSLKKKDPHPYLGWTCGFSDDAEDLLVCGSEVDGSCQRLEGDSNFNKCLLAYMCDGKNQLVVIKDRSGKIQARGVVKLLEGNNGEPVLFLEKFYPAILEEALEEALVQKAAEAAKGLGLPLLSKQIKQKYLKNDYQGVIRSNGGIARFEYEDTRSSICEDSKFEITDTCYVLTFLGLRPNPPKDLRPLETHFSG